MVIDGGHLVVVGKRALVSDEHSLTLSYQAAMALSVMQS